MRYINPWFSLEKPVLGVIYLSVLRDVLHSEGCEMRGCAMSAAEMEDHQRRITPKYFLDVLEKSLTPNFPLGVGFRFGEKLDMAAAGIVGQLLMAGETLEQTARHFLEYYPLLSLSTQFEVKRHDDDFRLRVDRIYRVDEPRQVQWFLAEALFYCALTQLRWLTGKPLHFKQLKLTYAKPPHWRIYSTMFGCPVEFSAPYEELTVDREFLANKVLTANKPVMLLKEQHCRDVLRRWQTQLPINKQIYIILNRNQPAIPCQKTVASQLNISTSSLYRKLREANTSFQKIVDDFRRDQALYYLQRTDRSIADIAEDLGFSDASNFRRAFKKWTGMTPVASRGRGEHRLSNIA